MHDLVEVRHFAVDLNFWVAVETADFGSIGKVDRPRSTRADHERVIGVKIHEILIDKAEPFLRIPRNIRFVAEKMPEQPRVILIHIDLLLIKRLDVISKFGCHQIFFDPADAQKSIDVIE